VHTPVCYQKILNTKILAILSAIIMDWQCQASQKKTETGVFLGKGQLMMLLLLQEII
jgi:hypothetical protein